MAIVFKEALEQIKSEMNFTLQIFATDLDKDGIDRARPGIYPVNIAADVSPLGSAGSLSRKRGATGSARRSGRW